MHENEIAREVVDAPYHIHSRLGPGLFESIYERIMVYELTKRGLSVRRQVPIPVVYDDLKLDDSFVADLIVEDKLIVELKSSDDFHPSHQKQLVTHLKLTGKQLGLLINFGAPYIKNGIKRVVNGLKE
jgi:GxxExxY protein